MATYVAVDSVYPTIGEVLAFVAVRSGLISATDQDPLYDRMKPFIREQKGKDFAGLEGLLDDLQDRLQNTLAPPDLGNITFTFFRRFLTQYKILITSGTVSVFGRERLMNGTLIPHFFVPYAALLLKSLSAPPFDFFDLEELLRSDAPLKVMLSIPLQALNKDWNYLAQIYTGKHAVRQNGEPVHDIDDKRKLIRKWGTGEATPDLTACINLLHALDWSKYSGYVFWVWIARFLQKIDRTHRECIADAICSQTSIPDVKELARNITDQNDAIGRMSVGHDVVALLRTLSALLFYDTYRNVGDKARVEKMLTQIRSLTADKKHTRYYISWLEAKYWLYCRNYQQALKIYEQAFYEGMYGDKQAETMILPEWAAVAQKLNATSALKRIDSRMKLLNIYPRNLDTDEVAAMRLEAFRVNFGSGRHFIECF